MTTSPPPPNPKLKAAFDAILGKQVYTHTQCLDRLRRARPAQKARLLLEIAVECASPTPGSGPEWIESLQFIERVLLEGAPEA